MKARYVILFAATLATSMVSQTEGGMDGGTLLNICTSEDALQKGYCIGYMVGYREGKSLNPSKAIMPRGLGSLNAEEDSGLSDTQIEESCVFPRLPHHQIRDVVINYIIQHPDTRNDSASSIITESLRVAFPCETGM